MNKENLKREINIMFENLAYELDCYDEEILFETEAVLRKLRKNDVEKFYFIDNGTDYEYSFRKPSKAYTYIELTERQVKDIRLKYIDF